MQYITSINPATLEEIGKVEITPEQKVYEYATKARVAGVSWARLSFKARAEYILRARQYLLDNMDDFALTITRDNGKPIAESLSAEIFPVTSILYWAAKNAEKILKRKSECIGIFNLMFRKSNIGHQPFGVIGVISPWNYPFSIPVGTIAMALMAGNTVLFKPSSSTALVGKKIEELFAAASLPEFVFTHIPGNADTGEALLNASVDKIVFTGSVGVGRHVAKVCAERLIPCTLELGGKDPAIIRADADLDFASSSVVWGAFTNAGQCCASIERVYVHEAVAEKFADLVVKKTEKLRVGNGENPNIEIGPMTTKSQLETVIEHVEDAKKRGALILTGGKAVTPGYFYEPTVISGVDHTFKCVMEETFGPTLPIMTFKDDQQAIHLANDSEYGLNAYIYSKDIDAAKRMAEQIRTGTVVINDAVYTHAIPETPWGGIKYSGIGRNHSKWGFYDLVNLHHVHTNKVTFIKDFWWYPYNKRLIKSLKKLSKTLSGCICSQVRGFPAFIGALFNKKI